MLHICSVFELKAERELAASRQVAANVEEETRVCVQRMADSSAKSNRAIAFGDMQDWRMSMFERELLALQTAQLHAGQKLAQKQYEDALNEFLQSRQMAEQVRTILRMATRLRKYEEEKYEQKQIDELSLRKNLNLNKY